LLLFVFFSFWFETLVVLINGFIYFLYWRRLYIERHSIVAFFFFHRFQSMDEDNSGVLTAEDLPRVEPLGCPTASHSAAVPKASLAKAAAAWKAALADCKALLPKEELAALKVTTRETAAHPPARRLSSCLKGRSGSPAGKKKTKKKTVSHDDVSSSRPEPELAAPQTANFDATHDLGLIRVRVKGSPQERGSKLPPRASREEASLLTGGGGGPSANEKRVAASVAERRSRASGDLLLSGGAPLASVDALRAAGGATQPATAGARKALPATAAAGSPRGEAASAGGARGRPGASAHDSPVVARKKSTVPCNPLEAGRLASVDGSPPASAEQSLSDASTVSTSTFSSAAHHAQQSPRKKPPQPRNGGLVVQQKIKDGKDGPQLA
jgi:hypothetical protein